MEMKQKRFVNIDFFLLKIREFGELFFTELSGIDLQENYVN